MLFFPPSTERKDFGVQAFELFNATPLLQQSSYSIAHAVVRLPPWQIAFILWTEAWILLPYIVVNVEPKQLLHVELAWEPRTGTGLLALPRK